MCSQRSLIYGGGGTSSGDDMPLFPPLYAVQLPCNSQWCGERRTAFLFFDLRPFTYVCLLCVWWCRIFSFFPLSHILSYPFHLPLNCVCINCMMRCRISPPLILSYPFHYFSCMWWCRIPPLISSQLDLFYCHICLISPFDLFLHLLQVKQEDETDMTAYENEKKCGISSYKRDKYR